MIEPAYNVPQKGLNLDINHSSNNDGTYSYALNAQVESNLEDQSFPYLSNIQSTIKCPNLIDGTILGYRYLQGLNINFLIVQKQEITYFLTLDENCNTEIRLVATCFNFKSQINIEYKLTDSTINFYFTDGEYDRYIQFKKDFTLVPYFYKNYSEGCDITYLSELDCDKTKWYPELNYPCIDTEIESGGSKKAGKYEYFIAYCTSKGEVLSSYTSATQGIHIYKDNYIGVDTDYSTNKLVKLTVTNLNPFVGYKYFTIVCGETINNITTYHSKGVYFIGSDKVTVYDVENGGVNVAVEELYKKYPYYKKSNYLTTVNNILIKGGVKEFDKYNLQPIVNKIKLNWFRATLKLGDYKDPEIASKYRGYLGGEVYSFGIKFILDNLEETPVFPLIGRSAKPSDLEVINNHDVVREGDCDLEPKQRWQVYNTATVTSQPNQPYTSCNNLSIKEVGDFAYWESKETYPNSSIWGTECGQSIRHFKFPDSSISPHYSSNNNGDVFIHPLGVMLSEDTNIEELLDEAVSIELITVEQRNRIRGYKIVRGNRAFEKSIVAKGVLYDMYKYTINNSGQSSGCGSINNTTYYYPNYPFNDLRDDTLISTTNNHHNLGLYNSTTPNKFVNENKYTFHSPDTSFVNPEVGNILTLEGQIHGRAEGYFSESLNQAKHKLFDQRMFEFAYILGKFIANSYQSPTQQQGNQLGSSIGSTVGGIAGGFFGVPGVGAALGGFVGGLVGQNVSGGLSEQIFRNTLTLNQTERFLQLFKVSAKYINYHYQYQAVGIYNKWKPLNRVGKTQRKIVSSNYISPNKISVNNTFINNLNKESSVYLDVKEIGKSLLDPVDSDIADRSRFTMSSSPLSVPINCYTYEENGTTLPFRIRFTRADGSIDYLTNGDPYLFIDDNGDPISRTWSFEATSYTVEQGGTDITISLCASQPSPKNQCDCKDTKTQTNISSFYATIKNNKVSQYGKIFDIQWIDINSCYVKISRVTEDSITINDITASCILIQNESYYFFGGDTYIGNFAFKRKHHFFNSTAFNLPNDTDIFYSDLGNVAYPTYYYNTHYLPTEIGSNISAISYPFGGTIAESVLKNIFNQFTTPQFWIRRADFKLDCYKEDTGNLFRFAPVNGVIYTYYYGIPNIIVESDINLDLRYAENNLEKDFYPRQKDLNFWLQEKNVSPKEDNYYLYNSTYSKQNTVGLNFMNDINFRGNDINKISFPNRIIYSMQSSEIDNSDYRDNYLIFKALDFHDFSFENGLLRGIKEIEGSKVLALFENQIQVFNAYYEINTNGDTAIIKAGDLFKQKPLEFSKADLGYIGSQHNIIKSTEFGHLIVDSKRGQIFLMGSNGQGVTEISNIGLKNWFKENLPFKISKIRGTNIDDSINGTGLSVGYDKRHNSIYLTKLDYYPKKEDITYQDGKFYYFGNQIELSNTEYFCDCSWTISYNFYTKSWISWYSFKPNLYIENIDSFYSIKNNEIWKHNIATTRQEIYGKLEPFIVETRTKYSIVPKIITSVSYYLEGTAYFNKGYIYNSYQNTGLLEFEKKNPKDLSVNYPIRKSDKTVLELSDKELRYNFNGFKNKLKDSGLSQFIYDCAISNFKNLNKNSFIYLDNKINNDYIRGDINYIRLINDKFNSKIVFKGLIDYELQSIR